MKLQTLLLVAVAQRVRHSVRNVDVVARLGNLAGKRLIDVATGTGALALVAADAGERGLKAQHAGHVDHVGDEGAVAVEAGVDPAQEQHQQAKAHAQGQQQLTLAGHQHAVHHPLQKEG